MSQFMLTKGNAPSTPPTGYSTIYIKSDGLPYVKSDAGVETPFVGATGAAGPTGPIGPTATVAVGTTSTLTAGSPATVTNSGSSSAAVFNFGVPEGITGAAGAAATVTVNTTTTLAPGTNATVTNAGSSSAAVLNFGIPQGAIGATGPTATISLGTTTTLTPDSSATVTNSGTSSAVILNFGIPRGTTSFISGSLTLNGMDGVTITHNKGDTSYLVKTQPTGTVPADVGGISYVKAANTVTIYNSGRPNLPADYELSYMGVASFISGSLTLNGMDGITLTHNKGDTSYLVKTLPTGMVPADVGEISYVKFANTVTIYNSGRPNLSADYELSPIV